MFRNVVMSQKRTTKNLHVPTFKKIYIFSKKNINNKKKHFGLAPQDFSVFSIVIPILSNLKIRLSISYCANFINLYKDI